ncbi:MAG: O-antigen/teichoic acid export membrane protein [Pirellulaceae bacterium]|jgi:O-antigen/teichoic acid export membrane protein
MIQLVRNRMQNVLGRLSSTQKKGLFGVGWTSMAQLLCMAIRIASTLVLTRLLAPEAYGIMSAATAVMTTLEWLSDFGVQPALIRHEKGDKKRFLMTGWIISVGRAFILSGIAMSCAWPLADFYEQPILFGVLLVVSLKPILLAVKSPGYPLIKRRMNFKALCVDEVVLMVTQTIASISDAIFIPNVWALVIGITVGSVASIIVSYILCPLRPAWLWDKEAVKAICTLSSQVFFNTLMMALWLNSGRLMGLKLMTAAELGVFAIAWRLSLTCDGLIRRACEVQFSMLSNEDGDEKRLKAHQAVCERVTRWLYPLIGFSIVLAPLPIWIIYDSRYAGAGLVFAILVARLMMLSLNQLQFQYLLAVAKVRLSTLAYVAAVIAQLSLLPFVPQFGSAGLAGCLLVSTTVLALAQTILLYRQTHTGLRQFFQTFGWMAAGLLAMTLTFRPYETMTIAEPPTKPAVEVQGHVEERTDERQHVGLKQIESPRVTTSVAATLPNTESSHVE